MTAQGIVSMIESIGLPYAYYKVKEDTELVPPVICFYFPRNRDFHADNARYVSVEELVIELYTPVKNFELEAKVEAALDANGLVYSREEGYYDEESLLVEVYKMLVGLEKKPVEDAEETMERDITEADGYAPETQEG